MRFSECWWQPVRPAPDGVLVGGAPLPASGVLDAGALGRIDGRALAALARDYRAHVREGYDPPLAALVCLRTQRLAALRGFFPLLRALDEHQRAEFEQQAARAAGALDLRLYEQHWLGPRQIELPPDAAALVAGQIVEVFFFRPDLLDRLLEAPARIWLYATRAAFQVHGGVGGGCYDPSCGAVRLELARVYEGFYSPRPGVAPLLHELGHLLDCFDPVRCVQGRATGLYPGMRPGDGVFETPEARAAFLRGKRLELERYRRRRDGRAAPGEPLPIGHPYVFQNDGEFLAGYLELFFRSPHAFAERNPDLHAGYAAWLGQDPRRVWDSDFSFYLDENRRFYLESGERPWPPGLTVL